MTTHIALALFQHAETAAALLLSRDSSFKPVWIPKAMIKDPSPYLRPYTFRGAVIQVGDFQIDERKLKEIGWVEVKDENQMEML